MEEKKKVKVSLLAIVIFILIAIIIGMGFYIYKLNKDKYYMTVGGSQQIEELNDKIDELESKNTKNANSEDKSNNEFTNQYFEKSYLGVTVDGPLYKFEKDGTVTFSESEFLSKLGTYQINEVGQICIKFTQKIELDSLSDDEGVITDIEESKILYISNEDNRVMLSTGDGDSYAYIENLVVY